jgi:hypothetical protein
VVEADGGSAGVAVVEESMEKKKTDVEENGEKKEERGNDANGLSPGQPVSHSSLPINDIYGYRVTLTQNE